MTRVARAFLSSNRKEAVVAIGDPPAWLLSVVIQLERRKGLWMFVDLDANKEMYGGGVQWRHGRLSKDDPHEEGSMFYRILQEKGLTFGQFEAELRDLTGYREGQE